MEGSLKELAGYRMDRAKEMLVAARENLEIGQYKKSLNRSYYAIFHAMRAMNILNGFDSSKHSGVIAFFNKEYLKENILDRNLSIVIKNSALMTFILQVNKKRRSNWKKQNDFLMQWK